MPWTISTTPDQGGTASAVLRDPEFGEVSGHDRRQFFIESDGGQIFTQDLEVEDRFLDVRWRWIDDAEWTGLLKVLRAGRWRFGTYSIAISGSNPFAVPLGTGQSIGGVPINTGNGLSTGDTVFADTATLGGLKLEQSLAEIETIRNQRGAVPLRFRLPPISEIQAGG